METITISRAEYERLTAQVSSLQQVNDYYKIPSLTVTACWAHVRQKYEEGLTGISEKEAAKRSNLLRGKQYCDRLFAIEKEMAGLPPNERLGKRKELAVPILKELHDWVFRLKDAPKCLLGKAAHYTRKYWQYLTTYLQDGRLEISNNRAERSIKPFVIGRKNFLFANTPRGSEGQRDHV